MARNRTEPDQREKRPKYKRPLPTKNKARSQSTLLLSLSYFEPDDWQGFGETLNQQEKKKLNLKKRGCLHLNMRYLLLPFYAPFSKSN